VVVVFKVVSIENKKKVDAPSKSTPITISCGVCTQRPILLPKPIYPPAGRFVRASGKVAVQILIDENGYVASAKAVSGHLLLRPSATKAALDSRWVVTKLGKVGVRVATVIVYNFEL